MSNPIDASGLSGCYRCFFVWRPRNPDPPRCPRCKSKLWDVPQLAKVRRGRGLGVGDVLGPHRAEVLAALRANRARSAMVFGSLARGAGTPRSDVDLLVDFDSEASAFDQIGLIDDLTEILGRKVDVTTREGLHWIVRPQVLVEAVPF